MKCLWNHTEKLAERCGMDEVRLFVVCSIMICTCIFLLAYAIAVHIIGIHITGMPGIGGICTILSGIVIGLFGSVLWMIRNEE